MGSEIKEITGMRDHKPWDWDQQFFKGSGTKDKTCDASGL